MLRDIFFENGFTLYLCSQNCFTTMYYIGIFILLGFQQPIGIAMRYALKLFSTFTHMLSKPEQRTEAVVIKETKEKTHCKVNFLLKQYYFCFSLYQSEVRTKLKDRLDKTRINIISSLQYCIVLYKLKSLFNYWLYEVRD